jgi:DeoR/GlpR family transcriptional regulator of sugar metabolism
MDIGTLLGIILALIAILLVLIFRVFDRDRKVEGIQFRLETFNKSADKFLNTASDILKEAQMVHANSQHLRPDFSIFLANQWRFIEKIFHYRYEKNKIAEKIVEKHIEQGARVFLDSGSTTDLVTAALLWRPITNVEIHSNNVFAAMHLAGIKDIPFFLFPGRFNDRFAAVYSDEANNLVDQLGLSLFILATTAFTFDVGITVHEDDNNNYEFKRKALLTFFKKQENSKLIIAIDASKFFEPVKGHKGIVTVDEWNKIKSEAANRIVIVTSKCSLDFSTTQCVCVEQEIVKFRNAGIQVDDV